MLSESMILSKRGNGNNNQSYNFAVIEVGNTWTSSSNSLTNVRRLAFLLVDFSLINGTLREFRFTTADSIAPVHLQVWRPLPSNRNSTQPEYSLIAETNYFSDDIDNVSVSNRRELMISVALNCFSYKKILTFDNLFMQVSFILMFMCSFFQMG